MAGTSPENSLQGNEHRACEGDNSQSSWGSLSLSVGCRSPGGDTPVLPQCGLNPSLIWWWQQSTNSDQNVPSLWQLYNGPRRTYLNREAIVLTSCSAFFSTQQGSPRCSCRGDLSALTCELNFETPSVVLTQISETFPVGWHCAFILFFYSFKGDFTNILRSHVWLQSWHNLRVHLDAIQLLPSWKHL